MIHSLFGGKRQKNSMKGDVREREESGLDAAKPGISSAADNHANKSKGIDP